MDVGILIAIKRLREKGCDEYEISSIENHINQQDVTIATLQGELELLENLSKLSGATDLYSKRS